MFMDPFTRLLTMIANNPGIDNLTLQFMILIPCQQTQISPHQWKKGALRSVLRDSALVSLFLLRQSHVWASDVEPAGPQ